MITTVGEAWFIKCPWYAQQPASDCFCAVVDQQIHDGHCVWPVGSHPAHWYRYLCGSQAVMICKNGPTVAVRLSTARDANVCSERPAVHGTRPGADTTKTAVSIRFVRACGALTPCGGAWTANVTDNPSFFPRNSCLVIAVMESGVDTIKHASLCGRHKLLGQRDQAKPLWQWSLYYSPSSRPEAGATRWPWPSSEVGTVCRVNRCHKVSRCSRR